MTLAEDRARSGFKQSEVGPIPTDWSVKLLPELCQFRGGKAHEQFVSEYGKYVCVNSKFISTDGAVRKFATKNFCPAKRGDILMVMSDLPNGKALAKTFIADANHLYAVNQRVCALTPNRDNSIYLAYALNRHPYFLKFDDGVSQTHLLNPVFQKCPVVLPSSIEEQEAIAAALSDADALIEGLESLIAKKRAIKQGAMQELLTGRRRLPGFSGEWRERSLGSLCEVLNGLTYSPNDVRESGVLVMRSSNIQDDALSFDSSVFVNMDIPSKCFVEKNDILICVRNGSRDLIGKCAKIDERCIGMAFGAFMAILRTPLHGFILHQFRSDEMKKQIAERLGATINQITNTSLKSFLVLVPPTEDEADAIASVLSDMDDEIDALVSRLAKARQIKQGMMQELLTGRIRLV